MDLSTKSFDFNAQPDILQIPFKPKSLKDRILSIIVHNKRYRLVSDYYYYYVFEGKVHRTLIKRGFIHDGATIFRFSWRVLKVTPDGKHRAHTLFHDYGYINKGNVVAEVWNAEKQNFESKEVFLSKKFLDKLYKRRIIEVGIPPITAKIMFSATRLLGLVFWPTLK